MWGNMDWTTIISAAVAAISAGGGIGIFFDRKHKKRAAELANESTVSSQWKELYERSEAKVNSQSEDRKSTRLNSSHNRESRMPSSA